MFQLSRTWSDQASRRPGLSPLSPIVGYILLALVSSAWSCPDDLTGSARACFLDYAVRLQSLQSSPQKLCCGLDVEIFRAFCRSYVDGSRCERNLRAQCPAVKQRVIDQALTSLEGARAGLNQLCLDDNIVEKYAMYQSCFYQSGPESESCFALHLLGQGGGENSIRFLETVSSPSKADFCRRMQATVSCVQQAVMSRCGQHAASLAAVLVKPMVRGSSECDYTASVDRPQQRSRETYQSNPAYISDSASTNDNNNNNKDGGSGSGSQAKDSNQRNAAATSGPSRTSVVLLLFMLILLHFQKMSS